MTEAERQQVLTAARDAVLAALPEALTIYVYGSFARGEEWPQSDLAVLLPPEQEIPDFLRVLADVSARVARDADLVDSCRAGDVLRREVLQAGRAIYVARSDRVLEWEATA